VRVFTGARAVASPLLMIPLGAGVAVMAGLLGFSLMCSLLDRDFTLTFVLLMALFFWLLSAVVVVMSVIYLQDSVMMRIGAGGAFGWLMLLPLAASLWATFSRPPCRPFFRGSGLLRWHVARHLSRRIARTRRLLAETPRVRRRTSAAHRAYRALTGVSLR